MNNPIPVDQLPSFLSKEKTEGSNATINILVIVGIVIIAIKLMDVLDRNRLNTSMYCNEHNKDAL